MDSARIRKELDQFQTAIKKLSNGVGNASSLWKDEKYSELNSSVQSLALQSKELMVYGDRCCNSLDRFNKIASENY